MLNLLTKRYGIVWRPRDRARDYKWLTDMTANDGTRWIKYINQAGHPINWPDLKTAVDFANTGNEKCVRDEFKPCVLEIYHIQLPESENYFKKDETLRYGILITKNQDPVADGEKPCLADLNGNLLLWHPSLWYLSGKPGADEFAKIIYQQHRFCEVIRVSIVAKDI
jgi:hypothetical protein